MPLLHAAPQQVVCFPVPVSPHSVVNGRIASQGIKGKHYIKFTNAQEQNNSWQLIHTHTALELAKPALVCVNSAGSRAGTMIAFGLRRFRSKLDLRLVFFNFRLKNERKLHPQKRAVVSKGRCANVCNQNIKALSKNATYFFKLGHCVLDLPF